MLPRVIPPAAFTLMITLLLKKVLGTARTLSAGPLRVILLKAHTVVWFDLALTVARARVRTPLQMYKWHVYGLSDVYLYV